MKRIQFLLLSILGLAGCSLGTIMIEVSPDYSGKITYVDPIYATVKQPKDGPQTAALFDHGRLRALGHSQGLGGAQVRDQIHTLLAGFHKFHRIVL